MSTAHRGRRKSPPPSTTGAATNTTTQATIARRDFSRATLRALAARGIEVIGAVAAPAYEGDVYFSGVSYQLVQDGCLHMRSFAEVKTIAAGAVLGKAVEEAA